MEANRRQHFLGDDFPGGEDLAEDRKGISGMWVIELIIIKLFFGSIVINKNEIHLHREG